MREPQTGRQWQVAPAKYLTRVQEREMAVQPDLILQLAHHIARDFAAHGHPGVEVHADARASLNGRPAATLVDPSADLAREADGLGAKPWIHPGPSRPAAAAFAPLVPGPCDVTRQTEARLLPLMAAALA